jgi:hypothetical protein
MFRNSLIATIVVATLVMLTAHTASADTIYSEDFEGATTGQSITASPLDWIGVVIAGSDVMVGEGAHGWASRYLDAGTAVLGQENLFQKTLTLPTTGTVRLRFKAYQPTGIHPVTGLQIDPYNGGFGFSVGSWGNGPRWWTGSNGWVFSSTFWQTTEAFANVPFDVDTTLEIYADYDNNKTWGIIKWADQTRVTAHYALTSGIDSLSEYADGRNMENMTRRNFDIDDIVVETLSPPGDITGTIDLADYAGDITKVQVFLDIMDSGSLVGSMTLNLKQDGTFSVASMAGGDYTFVFKACKWLNIGAAVTVVPNTSTDIGTITLLNGDLNGDNSVGFADFNILRKNWGSEGD